MEKFVIMLAYTYQKLLLIDSYHVSNVVVCLTIVVDHQPGETPVPPLRSAVDHIDVWISVIHFNLVCFQNVSIQIVLDVAFGDSAGKVRNLSLMHLVMVLIQCI